MENTLIAEQVELPGFRFHPTDQELLDFYLKNAFLGRSLHFEIITFLDIYQHEPWDLPGLSKVGEREWYFFVRRDRRQGHGGRPNRTTENGFWKATGSDRPIRCLREPTRMLGLRKTLVFYQGRAPRGRKTDWVMNEYRMPATSNLPKEDVVLCKIYRKATSLKVLEQRAAMELLEESKTPGHSSSGSITSPTNINETLSDAVYAPLKYLGAHEYSLYDPAPKTGDEVEEGRAGDTTVASVSLGSVVGSKQHNLTEHHQHKFSVESTIGPMWTYFKNPCLQDWSLLTW